MCASSWMIRLEVIVKASKASELSNFHITPSYFFIFISKRNAVNYVQGNFRYIFFKRDSSEFPHHPVKLSKLKEPTATLSEKAKGLLACALGCGHLKLKHMDTSQLLVHLELREACRELGNFNLAVFQSH